MTVDGAWHTTPGGARWFVARRWRGFANGTVVRVFIAGYGNLAIHCHNAVPRSDAETRIITDVIERTPPYPPGVSYR